jgi:hypothetical protein
LGREEGVTAGIRGVLGELIVRKIIDMTMRGVGEEKVEKYSSRVF